MDKLTQVNQFLATKKGYICKTEQEAIRLVEDVAEDNYTGDNWDALFAEFSRCWDAWSGYQDELAEDYRREYC